MRIVLAGGGTGGHIFPLEITAQKIKDRQKNAEFLYLGPKNKLAFEVMAKNNIPVKNILAGKMRRYFSWRNFLDFFLTIFGVFQSFFHLLLFMPDAIFAKGGFASLPVVLAGWLCRIPVMIHESDSIPGMANSVLGKFAKRIAVAYPQAENDFQADKTIFTGNLLRSDINQGDPQRARQKFSLTESKKVIFVLGGSLGARIINEKIVDILPELLSKYQVIHQTGEKNFKEVETLAGEMGVKAGREGYIPLAFIGEEIKDVYAVADLVVSRAGATSISEIAANGKPSIIVPLKNSANNHQRMNAYSVAKAGGCIVLEEDNLGKNLLLSRIEEIMENPELYAKLSRNIKVFFNPDAADKVADGILEMIAQ